MVKIKLPSTYEDITIKQVMQHGDKELNDLHLLRIYANLTQDEAEKLPMVLVAQAVAHIKEILTAPNQVHHKVIEVNGVKYGFIPDWEEFTVGEFIDMEKLCENVAANADKIMSVLYRPITATAGKEYKVATYEGTKGAERFQQVSAAYLYGALLFFSRIRNEYEQNGLRSLAKRTKQAIQAIQSNSNSTKGGAGIINYFKRLMATLRESMKRPKYQ